MIHISLAIALLILGGALATYMLYAMTHKKKLWHGVLEPVLLFFATVTCLVAGVLLISSG